MVTNLPIYLLLYLLLVVKGRSSGTSLPVPQEDFFLSLKILTFRMLPSQNRLIMVIQMALQARMQTACNQKLAKCLQNAVLPNFITVSSDQRLIMPSPNFPAHLGLSACTDHMSFVLLGLYLLPKPRYVRQLLREVSASLGLEIQVPKIGFFFFFKSYVWLLILIIFKVFK